MNKLEQLEKEISFIKKILGITVQPKVQSLSQRTYNGKLKKKERSESAKRAWETRKQNLAV